MVFRYFCKHLPYFNLNVTLHGTWGFKALTLLFRAGVK